MKQVVQNMKLFAHAWDLEGTLSIWQKRGIIALKENKTTFAPNHCRDQDTTGRLQLSKREGENCTVERRKKDLGQPRGSESRHIHNLKPQLAQIYVWQL